MCQLLETICIKNGTMVNIENHQKRIDKSTAIYKYNSFDLSKVIIPESCLGGTFKLRIIYSNTIEKIEFVKYTPKKINSLKVIEDNRIDYSMKYLDRTSLERCLSKKKECDDIIILKNNELSDTSFSNLLFIRNEEYFTPLHPLLEGTKRSLLLQQGVIETQIIKLSDIDKFEYCKIVNSMINIEESPVITSIVF